MIPVGRLSSLFISLGAHGFGPLVLELGVQEIVRFLPAASKWGRPRARTIGKRLRILFEDLGPTFQKFGQILSTQSDLLPDDIIDELQKLQVDIPPMTPVQLTRTLRLALGRNHPLLKTIDKKPLAVATIGQIHRAQLEDGTSVAVKVQRPGIEKVILDDLRALQWIAGVLLKAKPQLRKFNIQGVLQLFKRSLLSELNFKQECSNYQKMEQELDGLGITVPKVYPELSSERVLVLELIDGVPITRLIQNQKHPMSQEIAQKLLKLVLHQIFLKGHFHGDPHPGNFMLGNNNLLYMIDLGLVGELSPQHRKALVQALRAVLSTNAQRMAAAMLEMSQLPKKQSREKLVAELTPALKEIFSNVRKGAGLEKSLQQVFRAAASLDVIVDVEYVLMLKSLLTIESLCRQLDPEIRVFAIAKPIVFRGLLGWANPLEILRSRFMGR